MPMKLEESSLILLRGFLHASNLTRLLRRRGDRKDSSHRSFETIRGLSLLCLWQLLRMLWAPRGAVRETRDEAQQDLCPDCIMVFYLI